VGYCHNRCTGSCPGLSGSAPPSPFPAPYAFICTSPSPSASPSASVSISLRPSASVAISPSPSGSPSPSPSPSSGGGCFIGTVPVTLADGSGCGGWGYRRHPRGTFGGSLRQHRNREYVNLQRQRDDHSLGHPPNIPFYDSTQAGWYSFITNQTETSWPWLDAIQPIVGGSSLIKYDVATNTTSQSNPWPAELCWTSLHIPSMATQQPDKGDPTLTWWDMAMLHTVYLQPYIAAAGMFYSALLIDLVAHLWRKR